MQSRTTISDNYLAQQRELHKNPNYGVASLGYASIVKQVLDQTGIKALSTTAPESAICKRAFTISVSGTSSISLTILRFLSMDLRSGHRWSAASMCSNISRRLISNRSFSI